MEKAPYSFSEAQKLCKEYQYLAGQPFGEGNNTLINNIVITPFDQINKKRFIMYYLLFNDAEMALSHEYKGLLFDIMVIAHADNNHDVFHEDIHPWLSKNKFSFMQQEEAQGRRILLVK
jgi:hypothetical protein